MNDDWIPIESDKEHIAREKEKARRLRKTTWWKSLLAAGKCYYCGKIFPPGELTMDHIVPLSRGGKSTKGNVVVCCKQCNNDKKYYTPAELLLKKLKNDREDE